MNKNFQIFLFMWFSFYLGFKITIWRIKPPIVIDMPEEWKQIKTGDSLRVYKLNKDTIYLEFYNKRNR